MSSPRLMSPEGSQGSLSSRRSNYGTPTARKQALRNVLDRTQNLQAHPGSEAALETLEDVFREADNIHDDVPIEEKISNQDEVVMDSEVMSMSSKVIKSCTQVLTKECNTFSSLDFARKLMGYVQHLPDTTVNELNWSMLERDIPPFKTTAIYTCLLNKIKRVGKKKNKLNKSNNSANNSLNDNGSKEEAKGAKTPVKTEKLLSSQQRDNYINNINGKLNRTRLNDPNVTKVRPDEVIEVETDGDNENKAELDNLRRLIKSVYKENGHKPINYFKLALDPGDFGKTVENMLHLAFLAKDAFLIFKTDDDGNLVILPTPREMRENAKKNKDKNHQQNVINLDMETWRLLKDTYRLTSPMINF
ncbi:EP300-interacting inhibitor of differentiation 3 [Microplitis demolitor]|uniref:EP300-interacting inhibitor of differentiation 3 n=1 Tax=Microplitis demolitor TaxID=69319 RepID=UPI0004CD2459|nr:EP300-interacting inhibitor of differentiation 3 [Microplitis demolitor]